MLTDLMQDQRRKLVQQLQDKPGYVQADVVAALALLDILDLLTTITGHYVEPPPDDDIPF